jgi:3-oxoacyl-[acyl-carrier protein] reductase
VKASQERPWESGCALVTGGSRGIGAAIAVALAAEGWPVGVNYRSGEEAAAEVVARIEADGGRALAVQGDVADAAAVDGIFNTLEEAYGRVLVLVNNAGSRRDHLTAMLSEDDWSDVVETNMSGAYRTMSRGLGQMVRARYGRVVNISSISASSPLPGQLSYAASKAGLEAMTRTAAVEVARRGITVNAIAPGLVQTDMTANLDPRWTAGIPARRAATPDEIAGCVRFLVSPAASYITGTTLTVDGGLTAGISVVAVGKESNGQANGAAEPAAAAKGAGS